MASAGSESTLKAQNQKYLVAFVGLNIVVFFGLVFGVSADWDVASRETLGAVVASTLTGALAIVLNGLVGGNAKAVLVFWRIRNPLPGCRAFSVHMHTDSRIDPETLKQHYGPFPETEEQQNRLWYRLFQVHATTPSVLDAHRSYLLTRDLAVMSGLFLVALGPTAFVLADARDWAVIYTLSLALLFLSACHAARTYGKRLVTNVLAIESASAT